MSRNIFITNLSGHDQEFEIHGWNNNQNVVVGPHQTFTINAPDGSSGAIIALHDGHEGEQAEITKNGWGGNDFIDLSNIVGAGGNMTVQQVNNPATRKGDPLFMQHLNDAWHRADAGTRQALELCVHRDNNDNVTRIDAIKDWPALENFVRTFEDGKTYIGVGAWNGSPGNANDNNQSSAAQGNTDIQVTYNDGDATPPTKPAPSNTTSPPPKSAGSASSSATTVPFPKPTPSTTTTGTATAPRAQTSTNPTPSSPSPATTPSFVPLPESFKGRVQRGTLLPATWAEFQIAADNDGAAHGDISLQQGCDGAATVASTDGSGRFNGFQNDIVSGAPEAAVRYKADGTRALDTTVGNWNAGPNLAAIAWENEQVGQRRAYIVGGSGTDDVASSNKCFPVDFY
ncbi:MAG: hypothetical protein L6R36_007803 [Xanthoria steineri]|nr:MAG: hypothetical protein L6R36_007803 [Xanthoria steineri]